MGRPGGQVAVQARQRDADITRLGQQTRNPRLRSRRSSHQLSVAQKIARVSGSWVLATRSSACSTTGTRSCGVAPTAGPISPSAPIQHSADGAAGVVHRGQAGAGAAEELVQLRALDARWPAARGASTRSRRGRARAPPPAARPRRSPRAGLEVVLGAGAHVPVAGHGHHAEVAVEREVGARRRAPPPRARGPGWGPRASTAPSSARADAPPLVARAHRAARSAPPSRRSRQVRA